MDTHDVVVECNAPAPEASEGSTAAAHVRGLTGRSVGEETAFTDRVEQGMNGLTARGSLEPQRTRSRRGTCGCVV